MVFTLAGTYLGPQDVQVGGTRPENTIAPHLVELAAFGLALGLGSLVVYGRKGLHMAFLIPTLTVLLDIDHLPVYIGYAEPIRPAHSIPFIVITLAAGAITIKALDIELAMASAFMGHLAVDSGLFAPFAPLSFDYVQLDPYRIPLAAAAILLSLASGAVLRSRLKE